MRKKVLAILPVSIGGRLTTNSIIDGYKQNNCDVVVFDELKDKIKGVNEKQTREEQLENVIEKYINAEGYIHNNKDNMSEEQLNNMEKKQDNREIQIENLQDE